MFKYEGIEFDDIVDNQWSQICHKCIVKNNIDYRNLESVPHESICGVSGCNNEADYYIDFR